MSLKPVPPSAGTAGGGTVGAGGGGGGVVVGRAGGGLGALSLIREEGTMLPDSIRGLGIHDGAIARNQRLLQQQQQQQYQQQQQQQLYQPYDGAELHVMDDREVEVVHSGYLHKQVCVTNKSPQKESRIIIAVI